MYKPRGPYKRQFTVDKRQLKNILELWVHWCAFENQAISKITFIISQVYYCPQCEHLFCMDCDIFIHDSLHSCPGCTAAPQREGWDLSFIYLSPTIKTFDANFVMPTSCYNKTAFLYQVVDDFLRRFSSFKFFADYKCKWPQTIQG